MLGGTGPSVTKGESSEGTVTPGEGPWQGGNPKNLPRMAVVSVLRSLSRPFLTPLASLVSVVPSSPRYARSVRRTWDGGTRPTGGTERGEEETERNGHSTRRSFAYRSLPAPFVSLSARPLHPSIPHLVRSSLPPFIRPSFRRSRA